MALTGLVVCGAAAVLPLAWAQDADNPREIVRRVVRDSRADDETVSVTTPAPPPPKPPALPRLPPPMRDPRSPKIVRKNSEKSPASPYSTVKPPPDCGPVA
jgi:hypothetical protein